MHVGNPRNVQDDRGKLAQKFALHRAWPAASLAEALRVVSSSAWLGRAWWLLGDGIDDVGFDTINAGGSKPIEDLVPYLPG